MDADRCLVDLYAALHTHTFRASNDPASTMWRQVVAAASDGGRAHSVRQHQVSTILSCHGIRWNGSTRSWAILFFSAVSQHQTQASHAQFVTLGES